MVRAGAALGIADHLGWAVAVTASPDHRVVDRRRIALVGPELSEAPIHYDRGQSSDEAIAALLADARASIAETSAAAFDELDAAASERIASLSLRTWPPDHPTDLATLRRPPYEARADAVMYRQVLAEVAEARGWTVHLYDAKTVERRASELLGPRAGEGQWGPRRTLGPPWAKDHRTALAATVLASPGSCATW